VNNNSPEPASSNPKTNEASNTDVGEKIAIIVVGAVVFSALIGIFIYSIGTKITVPDTVKVFDLIDVFGPLLFSFLVALIYWQLYDVQKAESSILNQQKEIQNRQRKIEAQQNRPYVVVEDTHEMPDERKVLVKASNFGPAPATNLSLTVRADENEQTVGARRLRRNEDGYSGYEGLGDFLRPDDEYIQFHVRYPDLNWLSFESQGQSSVVVKAGLEYTDIMDEEYFYPLQRAEVIPKNKTQYPSISWESIREVDPPY
jgi:hypothetical protein